MLCFLLLLVKFYLLFVCFLFCQVARKQTKSKRKAKRLLTKAKEKHKIIAAKANKKQKKSKCTQ
jgi:hypothetical protein